MHDFKLTSSFLDKLTAASAALNIASAKLSPAERKSMMESGSDGSLAERARQIEKHRAAVSAIKGAGLSTRDYLLGSMVLLTSSMSAQVDSNEKLPPEVSPDNVKFVKTHQEQVGKWGAIVQQGMDADEKKEKPAEATTTNKGISVMVRGLPASSRAGRTQAELRAPVRRQAVKLLWRVR
jgi:hypothetical protein